MGDVPEHATQEQSANDGEHLARLIRDVEALNANCGVALEELFRNGRRHEAEIIACIGAVAGAVHDAVMKGDLEWMNQFAAAAAKRTTGNYGYVQRVARAEATKALLERVVLWLDAKPVHEARNASDQRNAYRIVAESLVDAMLANLFADADIFGRLLAQLVSPVTEQRQVAAENVASKLLNTAPDADPRETAKAVIRTLMRAYGMAENTVDGLFDWDRKQAAKVAVE